MRALTLTQPWAGLVASGIKLIENRPRAMGAQKMIGERIAIHASRTFDERVMARIQEEAPDLWWSGEVKRADALWRITSKVIAVATIDTVIVSTHEDDGGWDLAAGCRKPTLRADGLMPIDQLRWFFGPVGIVLRDVQPLEMPISCTGMLGFWTLSPAVDVGVRMQVSP